MILRNHAKIYAVKSIDKRENMKKMLITLPLMTLQVWAGFNFGECSGSGTFEQEIIHYNGDYETAITVGDIPAEIEGLKILLISDKDVDIRLYGEGNDKIVHWPFGIHNQSDMQTKLYQGVNVTYSGYNGVSGKKGHEFIEIDDLTPTPMTMKAFGYQAGFATINYSWTGKKGCTPQAKGNGNFTQALEQNSTSLVGTIPPNIFNLTITLRSQKDLDIQLYGEDGTAIVSWKPKGLLSEAGEQSIAYHDMNITWAGYNGTHGEQGNEYIKITGENSEMLVMKVFGYEAGLADVNYSWGNSTEPCISKDILKNKIADGQDVTQVNTSCINNMDELFKDNATFNQDISKWDVSNVQTMRFMFTGAKVFNQDISKWNVSNVTNMNDMFAKTEHFNQAIGNWDVSSVENINGMFWEAKSFNQPLGDWNVSTVTYMPLVFFDASAFNQDISRWDVSKVTSMFIMFKGAKSFNQNISQWDVSHVTNHEGFSTDSPLEDKYKPHF